MKQSMFFKGLVLAVVALPLVAGCKKKDGSTGAGSAGSAGSATMAAGSGSATMAAGSGSATMAGAGSGSGSAVAAGSGSGSAAADPAAPWAADTDPVPATSKVTGTRDGTATPGTFDRGIYFKSTDKYGSVHHEIHLTNGCDKLSCSDYVSLRGGIYADDKYYKDCANATTMDITIDGDADPKPGPIAVRVGINTPERGGDFSADPMKGSSITAISDKEVKGKIDVKADKSVAKGEFTVKNCGVMLFPKQ